MKEISIWARAVLLRALRREAADYITASKVKRYNELADKIERGEILVIKNKTPGSRKAYRARSVRE